MIKTNHEKGVILLVVLMVIVVVSIYLPAYLTWSIWDQKSLIRQQRAEEAKEFARAGLNRAALDLYMDSNSWLDGNINGWTVHTPDSGQPDNFWTLYSSPNWTLWDGSFGNYTVWIDYLQNPSGGGFYDKRMRVHSTGTVTGSLGTLASSTLEQYVNYYVVKNIGQDPTNPADDKSFYSSLQPAIDDAVSNDTLAITAATWTENININAKQLNIQGCYDPTFSFRSCSNYYTSIHGNWTVTGGANVNLSGVTIN